MTGKNAHFRTPFLWVSKAQSTRSGSRAVAAGGWGGAELTRVEGAGTSWLDGNILSLRWSHKCANPLKPSTDTLKMVHFVVCHPVT
jgi:hypothetical protein